MALFDTLHDTSHPPRTAALWLCVDPATGHDILVPGDDLATTPPHRTVYPAAVPVPELS